MPNMQNTKNNEAVKPLELFETNAQMKRYLASLLQYNEHPIGEEFEFRPGVKCIERSTGNTSTEQLLLVNGNYWEEGVDVLGYLNSTGELELTIRKPNSNLTDKSNRYFTLFSD